MADHARPKLPRVRVAVVLVDDQDRILLVRHRKGEKTYWLLPGGGLDFGESLFACAARELREETGLEVEASRMLYVSEAISPDGARHILNLYVMGTVTGGALGPPPEGDVIDEIAWKPIAELPTLTLYPAIAEHILASHAEGFAHEVRYLGSRWT